LDICVAGDTVKHCLTPELARLKPYPDLKARPCKEILNFPSASRQEGGNGGLVVESPHYQFRNLLYVSPKELNFSNRSGGDRARNIAVKAGAIFWSKIRTLCPSPSENDSFTRPQY
jgi:hypothetical protein